nr:orf:PZF129 [Saccharomyces cerevisiae]CAA98835.1 unnamed protein product [Saccharomyces cerevisiae]
MSCSFHISSPLGSSSSLEGFSSLKVVVVACQALSRDLLGIDLVLLLLFWRPDKHPHWASATCVLRQIFGTKLLFFQFQIKQSSFYNVDVDYGRSRNRPFVLSCWSNFGAQALFGIIMYPEWYIGAASPI